jgi:hypothetical protein
VSFQNYPGVDIYVINGGPDQYFIGGCRTETANFLLSVSNNMFVIDALSHSPGTGQGYIVAASAGYVTCKGIVSTSNGGGWFEGSMRLSVENSQLDLADYLTHGSTANYAQLDVKPQRIVPVTTSRSMISADGSAKIQFNSASAQTYTVLKNSDASCGLLAGSFVDIQQIGAGQLTIVASSGVTVHSSAGLKMRAQYSCARLTCDGADTWTLSGDTTV